MEPREAQRLANDMVDDVNCDGFDGYFFNSEDDPAQALLALEAIGAMQTAAIVRRAFARFPGGVPPSDRFERQAILLDVVTRHADGVNVFEREDNDLFAYPEDVELLAARHVEAAERE